MKSKTRNVLLLLLLIVLGVKASIAQAGMLENEVPGDIPPEAPLWFSAEQIAKAFPTKENLALLKWSLEAEKRIVEPIRSQQNLKLFDGSCCFLVNKDGKFYDILDENLRPSAEAIKTAILGVNALPSPPSFLENRRLHVEVTPKMTHFLIDFHDPAKTKGHFDKLRKSLK